MNANHELLQTLTVSSPELDRLVQVAVSSGAEGAKLSGGGRGGNLIALVTPQTAEQVRYALLQAGANRVFQTEVGGV
jgi:mevalonate kinase